MLGRLLQVHKIETSHSEEVTFQALEVDCPQIQEVVSLLQAPFQVRQC